MALAMRDGRSGDDDRIAARLRELAALVDPDDVDAQRERLQLTDQRVDRALQGQGLAHDRAAVRRRLARGRRARRAHARRADGPARVVGELELRARAPHRRAHRRGDGAHEGRLRAPRPDLARRREAAQQLRERPQRSPVHAHRRRRTTRRPSRSTPPTATPAAPTRSARATSPSPTANQSIDAQNAGDWQSARPSLQQCVAELPDDAALQGRPRRPREPPPVLSAAAQARARRATANHFACPGARGSGIGHPRERAEEPGRAPERTAARTIDCTSRARQPSGLEERDAVAGAKLMQARRACPRVALIMASAPGENRSRTHQRTRRARREIARERRRRRRRRGSASEPLGDDERLGRRPRGRARNARARRRRRRDRRARA